RRGGDLRRDRLPGEPAHARDRRAVGVRRAAGAGASPDRGPCAGRRGDRHRRGTGRRGGAHPRARLGAVRGEPHRSGCVRRSGAAPDRDRRRRELDPGAARGRSRAIDCVAGGVTGCPGRAEAPDDDARSVGVSGWRAHHRQPVHPAGGAARDDAHRPVAGARHPPHAGRHDDHVRGGGIDRDRERGVADTGEHRRPLDRAGPARAGRGEPALSTGADALAALPVRLGARLDRAAGSLVPGVAGNAVIGAAVALLWAPCAGPILGLVVAITAAGGWSARSASLYLAFAAGAALSLAVVLFAGARLLERLRRGAGVDRWVRRALGAAAMAVVVLLASGRDSALFARAGVSTAPAEARLVALVRDGATPASSRPG